MLKTLTSSVIEKPQNTNFEGEDGDEEILYIFRQANITNFGWAFSGIILLLAPIFFNSFIISVNKEFPGLLTPVLVFIINIFWYIFVFGYIFERFLHWFFNVYIITSKRVVDMDFDNLLHRNISEAPLRNIEDITYTVSGTLPTVFNYGNLSIQTAAEKREIEFANVYDPGKLQDILSDLVSFKKGHHGS
jgi:hypothetical protein